jgi:hypothetical protein
LHFQLAAKTSSPQKRHRRKNVIAAKASSPQKRRRRKSVILSGAPYRFLV